MSYSVAQSSQTAFNTAATSNTYQYPSAVTSGHALMCTVIVNDGGAASTLTVSDSVNGSWTQAAVSREDTTTNLTVFIFYCLGTSAGQPTLTITSSVSTFMYVHLAEVSGIATASAADGSGIGNGSASSPMTTNSFTTTAADFVYGGAIALYSVSSFSPWTQLQYDSNNGVYSFYQAQTTAGSMSAAIALTGSNKWWTIAIAAFKPTAGTTTVRRMMLLGVGS